MMSRAHTHIVARVRAHTSRVDSGSCIARKQIILHCCIARKQIMLHCCIAWKQIILPMTCHARVSTQMEVWLPDLPRIDHPRASPPLVVRPTRCTPAGRACTPSESGSGQGVSDGKRKGISDRKMDAGISDGERSRTAVRGPRLSVGGSTHSPRPPHDPH